MATPRGLTNQDALFNAIDEEDMDKIERLWRDDELGRHERVPEDMTSLMYAVSQHKVAAVSKLLNLGANPSDSRNWEVLHWAVRDHHYELIKILLDHGANPDSSDADHDGATSLTRAAHMMDLKAIKLLRDAGCDINKPGILGDTALSLAISWLNLENPQCIPVLQYLLENGADPTLENYIRFSSLEVACGTQIPANLFKIMFECCVNKWRDDEQKARQIQGGITKCILSGRRDLMWWLLDKFTENIQRPKFAFKTMLFKVMTKSDDPEMARVLINKAGGVDIVDVMVMNRAVECPMCMREFLISGVNPDIQVQIDPDFLVRPHPFQQWSGPLIYAIESKKTQVAIGLIQANCDVNRAAVNSRVMKIIAFNRQRLHQDSLPPIYSSPLGHALAMGLQEIANALCDAGCNLSEVRGQIKQEDMEAITEDIIDWLYSVTACPRTLKSTSRIVIRRCLPLPILESVIKLELPSPLRDFLMMREYVHALL